MNEREEAARLCQEYDTTDVVEQGWYIAWLCRAVYFLLTCKLKG